MRLIVADRHRRAASPLERGRLVVPRGDLGRLLGCGGDLGRLLGRGERSWKVTRL
jgi:hypothetical protein